MKRLAFEIVVVAILAGSSWLFLFATHEAGKLVSVALGRVQP